MNRFRPGSRLWSLAVHPCEFRSAAQIIKHSSATQNGGEGEGHDQYAKAGFHEGGIQWVLSKDRQLQR